MTHDQFELMTNNQFELMTPDQFEKYIKQSFNQESDPQEQPHFPRDLFGKIKLQTQPPTHISQPVQPNHVTQSTQPAQLPQPVQHVQPIRTSCMGAIGPNQPNISFGEALSNLKKEKTKNEIIESLYAELSSIRLQIELLTKTTDNIYRILNKL